MIHKLLDLISIDGAFISFIKTKKFSLASYKMIRRLKKKGVCPQTVIDIGANKGQFSILANYILNPSNIIAIEANPDLEKDLYRNLSNIECIKFFN